MKANRLGRVIATAAVAVFLQLGLLATAALGQSPYPGGNQTPPPNVGGKKFTGDEPLGRTGWNILAIILIALLVLLIGVAIRRLASRTTAES